LETHTHTLGKRCQIPNSEVDTAYKKQNNRTTFQSKKELAVKKASKQTSRRGSEASPDKSAVGLNNLEVG